VTLIFEIWISHENEKQLRRKEKDKIVWKWSEWEQNASMKAIAKHQHQRWIKMSHECQQSFSRNAEVDNWDHNDKKEFSDDCHDHRRREKLLHMSNNRQLWLSLFLKRKLSENLRTENWLSLFSKTDYHLTFWVDFLQNFRSYSFQSAVFTNIISNSTASNYIFRKMLNIEILESFASANQFEHQNHQFPPPGLIYARWLSHILWET